MRELVTMWKNSRMIMLTAVTAAIFAAILIPFKAITIIPGVTSVRPANVIPVVFGIMFGPAGAWGAGIGNLIGDIFGGNLSPTNAFGFVGNFMFAYLSYKLWGNLGFISSGQEPDMRSGKQVVEFLIITLTASAACAAIIAWGLEIFGIFPFSVLGVIITLNNFLAAGILGPPLLYLTYPRIKNMGLLYPEVMDPEDLPSSNSGVAPAALAVVVIAIAWLVIGIAISLGQGVELLASTGDTFGQGGTVSQMILGGVAFVLLAASSMLLNNRLPSLLGYSSE